MNKFAKMLAMWSPHNWNSAQEDKIAFNKWEKGTLTTRKTINRFLRNNKIVVGKTIDEDEFELWLNSLGYFRSLTPESAENPYK